MKTNLKDMLKNDICIEEVYSRYFEHVSLTKGYIHVECPSCHNKKFTLFAKTNSYKCFTCEVGGDIFKLFNLIHNTSDFPTALYTIARDWGYVTQEYFENIINYKYKNDSNKDYVPPKNFKVIKREKSKKRKSTDVELQDLEVRHNIYEVLSTMPDTKINEAQHRHLELDRKLNEKVIKKDFFNMPKIDDNFMSKLFSEIKIRFGYEKDKVLGVPGFYKDKNGKILFVQRYGLGIKLRGANGLIYGLQVRIYKYIDKKGKMVMPYSYSKENKCKYFFASSSELGDGCTHGCSSGSPVDVKIPENNDDMYSEIYITEGKFKSEIIATKYNCPSISVQGVGSWKGKILPEIDYINKNFNKNISTAYICYDADMAINLKVYNQCKKMVLEELTPNNITSQMLVWDYHLGKGIDDIILNGEGDKIKKVDFKDYMVVYEKFLERLYYLYPKSTSTDILDDNEVMIDDEIIFNIYEIEVLEKLKYSYLKNKRVLC